MGAAVGMTKPNINAIRVILDKGGDPHEDGVLQRAVAYASLGGRREMNAEVNMREDIALLLLRSGACGQVPKRYRHRCPARLAAVLDSKQAWVSDREANMAAEEHVSQQWKLD